VQAWGMIYIQNPLNTKHKQFTRQKTPSIIV